MLSKKFRKKIHNVLEDRCVLLEEGNVETALTLNAS
jgi:hypothetical protein